MQHNLFRFIRIRVKEEEHMPAIEGKEEPEDLDGVMSYT